MLKTQSAKRTKHSIIYGTFAPFRLLNVSSLGSRIDAVASRLESAVRMKQVTNAMAGIVKGLDKAMQSMDMAKVLKNDIFFSKKQDYSSYGPIRETV
jgi:hypothetical protein